MRKRTTRGNLCSSFPKTDDAKGQGQAESVVAEHAGAGVDAHSAGEPVLESFLRSVLEIPNHIQFSTSGDIHAGCLKALVCNLAPNHRRTAFEKDSETMLRAWDELPPHIAAEETDVRDIDDRIACALDKAAEPAGPGKWLAFRKRIYSLTDYRPERLPTFAARLPRKNRLHFRRLARLYDEWLQLRVGRIFKVETISPSASALTTALHGTEGKDPIANRQQRLDAFVAELGELVPELSPVLKVLVARQSSDKKREEQGTRHFYFEVLGAMKAQETWMRDFCDRLPEEFRGEYRNLNTRTYDLGRGVAVALAAAHAAGAETRYKVNDAETRGHPEWLRGKWGDRARDAYASTLERTKSKNKAGRALNKLLQSDELAADLDKANADRAAINAKRAGDKLKDLLRPSARTLSNWAKSGKL